MAQNEVLKRYIDSGLAFTAMTQARAEALVKELVKVGEVQAEQARDLVSDLVDRGRRNSEELLETVRREVKQQITSLGLVSKADLEKAEARLASLVGTASGPVRKAAEPVRKAAEPVRKAAAQATKQATRQAGTAAEQATEQAPQQAAKATGKAAGAAGRAASKPAVDASGATSPVAGTSPAGSAGKVPAKKVAPKKAAAAKKAAPKKQA